MATANLTTLRTIHETLREPLNRIEIITAPGTTGSRSTGILALLATLPGTERRAKFTMPHIKRFEDRFFGMRGLPLSIFFR